QNKPSSFPPSSHTHAISDITDLQQALDSKETPQGAQQKADQAETNAKAYTDTVFDQLNQEINAHVAQDASQNNVHGLRGNKIALGEDSSVSEGYAVAVGPQAEAGGFSVALGAGSSAPQA